MGAGPRGSNAGRAVAARPRRGVRGQGCAPCPCSTPTRRQAAAIGGRVRRPRAAARRGVHARAAGAGYADAAAGPALRSVARGPFIRPLPTRDSSTRTAHHADRARAGSGRAGRGLLPGPAARARGDQQQRAAQDDLRGGERAVSCRGGAAAPAPPRPPLPPPARPALGRAAAAAAAFRTPRRPRPIGSSDPAQGRPAAAPPAPPAPPRRAGAGRQRGGPRWRARGARARRPTTLPAHGSRPAPPARPQGRGVDQGHPAGDPGGDRGRRRQLPDRDAPAAAGPPPGACYMLGGCMLRVTPGRGCGPRRRVRTCAGARAARPRSRPARGSGAPPPRPRALALSRPPAAARRRRRPAFVLPSNRARSGTRTTWGTVWSS
jgi:hypothetical protein